MLKAVPHWLCAEGCFQALYGLIPLLHILLLQGQQGLPLVVIFKVKAINGLTKVCQIRVLLKYIIQKMCEGIYSFTNYLRFDEHQRSLPYEIFTVVYYSYIPNNILKAAYVSLMTPS